MKSMKILNDFYIMNIEINGISCEDSERERKNILKWFADDGQNINILFNIINILDIIINITVKNMIKIFLIEKLF